MIPANRPVVLVLPNGKRYIKIFSEDQDWQNNDGTIKGHDVLASDYGEIIITSLGTPIRLEEATLDDLIMGIKRQTQIIYPKDIAYICLRMGAGPGRKIVEAGCGSGGLTLALSWFCGNTGKVISHDAREEFIRLAQRNLSWAGLGENVEWHCQDISEGFCARNADSVFLDVREPWLYLKQVQQAIKKGGMAAFLLPTMNQISELLLALENEPFGEVEIVEILIRQWKALADRLRPKDRMTAHTGFIVFCRQQVISSEFDTWLPRGTRERKQDMARENRENR